MKLDPDTKIEILRQLATQIPNAVYTPKTDWLLSQTRNMQFLLKTGSIGSAPLATLKQAHSLGIIKNHNRSDYRTAEFSDFWDEYCEEYLGYRPLYMLSEMPPDPPKLNLSFTVDGVDCQYAYSWDKAFHLLKGWGLRKKELLEIGLKEV